MTRVGAVGFDLDGTLFDHHGSARSAAAYFLGSLGVVASDSTLSRWFDAEEENFERWRSGEISFSEQRRQRLRSVLPALGVDVPASDVDVDELFGGYLRAYESSWRAFPDALPLLQSLRASGHHIGLLTNGTEAQQLAKLRRTGLLDEFDVVCTSERIGFSKPDVRAFAVLASELEVEPGACLFVGDDAKKDVDGARAAGMQALLVDGHRPRELRIAELVGCAIARSAGAR
ncbi:MULTISPECIES: HAD family hydrolase [unclassified Frigoribacterium]|uniref:HAD family hydrolase n=1 Tax=unclassified Frigoribacterium TaxID=2627005 RepID=UPI0009E975D7|nr:MULTISPECIES: HAD family hydrolase [unclassified Frigoribacterium]WAC51856.1 HAD family hydrolase [Frigoribacterium sp. SL97]